MQSKKTEEGNPKSREWGDALVQVELKEDRTWSIKYRLTLSFLISSIGL